MKIISFQSGVRLPDGHLVRFPHGAVKRRRPLERDTPLFSKNILKYVPTFWLAANIIKISERDGMQFNISQTYSASHVSHSGAPEHFWSVRTPVDLSRTGKTENEPNIIMTPIIKLNEITLPEKLCKIWPQINFGMLVTEFRCWWHLWDVDAWR